MLLFIYCQAHDFGEQQRVKTFNIDFSGPLPQPIIFSKNERIFIVIKQVKTGNYDEINSQYTFRFYAPNKMDQYDLDANPEYGNVPMYASDLGIDFHIEYPTLHYNDYDYYTFTPEYDGTEITATLGSTSSDLLYDINLYENVIIDLSQPTLYPTNPIASGIKEDNKKILKYNELKSGTKYYLEVKSPSPKTIYDSQNPYELTVIKKNTYSAVLKNDIILEHTAGNNINTTKDFFDIIMQNIECKVSDSIIPSDEARGHIQLIYNDRALSYSDINKLKPGEYPIIVKFYGDAATGGSVTLKVSEDIILQDGILYPGMDVWWKTEKDEDLENYYFTLDSVDVIYNNKKYTVPEKTFKYLNETGYHDYDALDGYQVCIQISNDGIGEYILYNGDDVTNQIVYHDTYAIIPVIHFWAKQNGEIVLATVLSYELYSDKNGFVNDGIERSAGSCWWGTSIYWEIYSNYYPDELFPVCNFSLDEINVICKWKKYEVKPINYIYNVILADYDYEILNSYYLIYVQVDYDGTAEYKLSNDDSLSNYQCDRPIYYDTYAIIPILWVYADENGQLCPIFDTANESIFAKSQQVHQSLVPIKNYASGIRKIAANRNSAVALTTFGDIYVWGDGAYSDLGLGNTDNVYSPIRLKGLLQMKEIAKGKNHTLALDVNGNVWGWGNNSSGEVHGNLKGKVTVPTQIPDLSNVVSIAAGTGFSAAVKDDGTVWTWGNSSDDRLGDRESTSTRNPGKVIGISNVTKITCGENFVAALSGGNLYTWGDNTNGQLGDGTNTSNSTPQLIGNGYSDIAAGSKHILAVKNNDLYSWGYNYKGQLGLNSTVDQNTPQYISSNVTKIGAGTTHSLFVSESKLYSCGYGSKGQLGIGRLGNSWNPTLVSGLDNVNISDIDGGAEFSLVLDNEGNVWSCGINTNGQLGIYSNTVTE